MQRIKVFTRPKIKINRCFIGEQLTQIKINDSAGVSSLEDSVSALSMLSKTQKGTNLQATLPKIDHICTETTPKRSGSFFSFTGKARCDYNTNL